MDVPGSRASMSYDAAHQLSSLFVEPPPATGPNFAFSYDAQGNRATKRTSLGAPVAAYA